MSKGTSTFTIHHDRCDPSKWTARDFVILGDFVRTGNLQYAAHLSRLGMQLVLSELHVAKGGEVEEIGWADPDCLNGFADTLDEVVDDDGVVPVVRIYRGPVEYAVRYGIGDGEGNFEGYEHKVLATEADAERFAASMNEPESETTALRPG